MRFHQLKNSWGVVHNLDLLPNKSSIVDEGFDKVLENTVNWVCIHVVISFRKTLELGDKSVRNTIGIANAPLGIGLDGR